MKKYKCPKCGNIFAGKKDICPSCGTPMHYRDEVKQVEVYNPMPSFHFDAADVNNDGLDKDEEFEKALEAERASKPVYAPNAAYPENGESYFDGKLIQRIGYQLLGLLIIVCSGLLAFPWATCLVYSWEAKHTVINGRRLSFDGTGKQLFGRYILWLFLSIITVGIFTFWLVIFVKRWKAKHTHFAPFNENDLTQDKDD